MEDVLAADIPVEAAEAVDTNKAKSLASTSLSFASRLQMATPQPRQQKSGNSWKGRGPPKNSANLRRQLDEVEDSVAKRLKAEISDAEAATEKCRIELAAKEEAAAQHLEAQRRAAEVQRRAAEAECVAQNSGQQTS